MITLGLDIGSRFVKACVLRDENMIGYSSSEINGDLNKIIKTVKKEAIKSAKIFRWNIKKIICTGAGLDFVKRADYTFNVPSCIAAAANKLDKEIGTIVDVGGLFIDVININNSGRILEFVEIEKCAAGSGKLLENIAKAVEVPISEISRTIMKSQNPYILNSGCAVFAESEIISQVNAGAKSEDILSGLMKLIVSKVVMLINKVDSNDKVAITGGIANFEVFKTMIEVELKKSVVYLPIDNQLAAAFGAALIPSSRHIKKNI